MTEKIFYTDSHIMNFAAEIISCESYKNSYAVILSRTAFFPEGGGQSADTGYINGVRVTDVQEKNGEILHIVESELLPGPCSCELDAQQRLNRMQNHSGEHIVSGLVNSSFGFDNVGFHMSTGFMTIDFSGELSWEQLMDIEKRANMAVRENIEIIQHFPADEQLPSLQYRSKLELISNVRLVEIPGIDICACCAPHVQHTGEIGMIKILSSERHRGGTRVTLCCGMDALAAAGAMQENITAISAMLSAKREDTAQAVRRLMQERDELKYALAGMEAKLVAAKAEQIAPCESNICLFEELQSEAARIELVNRLVPKCTGMAAVFTGSDEQGYRYIIGSASADLRSESKAINAAIGGKGGGKPEMIMGRASKTAAEIKEYFGVCES